MIHELTLDDALTVVRDMRERDRRCVEAMLGKVDDEVFAVDRWQTSGPAWSLHQDGVPVAIYGLQLPNAWTAVAWLLCRPRMSGTSWRKLVRHCRTVAGNVMAPGTAAFHHRVEAYVMADWREAAAFAHRLGFEFEGTRRAAGKGGEDVQMWAMVWPGKG